MFNSYKTKLTSFDKAFDNLWATAFNELSEDLSASHRNYLVESSSDKHEWIFPMLAIPKENIKVIIDDGYLNVTGHTNKDSKIPNEVSYKTNIPLSIDTDKITSHLKDGVLYVTGQVKKKSGGREVKVE